MNLLSLMEKLLKKRISVSDIKEVISYNKNLLTGAYVELKKLKPVNGTQTKIKVLIFDALTGKLEQEAVTQNVINTLLNKQAFSQWFVNDLIPPVPTRTTMWSLSFRSVGGNRHFKRLFLTDYTEAENENSLSIRGNLIGYALRDTLYTGTDIQRGTINLLESNITFNGTQITIHVVFDFPTHAANGTFQSIWWGTDHMQLGSYFIESSGNLSPSTVYPDDKYYNFIKITNNCSTYFSNSNYNRYIGRFRFHCTARYNADTSGAWTIYKWDLKYMSMLATPVKLKWSNGSDYIDTVMQYCIPYDDITIGFYYNSSSSNVSQNGHIYNGYTLYKFVWNTTDGTLTSLTALSRDALKDAGARHLNWTNTNGCVQIIDRDIYIWGYYDITTEYKQYRIKLNEAFTGIAESLLITPVVPLNYQYYIDNPADTGKKCYISRVNVMKDFIQICWYNTLGSGGLYYDLYDRNYNHLNYMSSTYEYNCYDTDGTISYTFNSYPNTNKVYSTGGVINCFLKYQRPQAQTLLAAPITKTATNTMKIQYDFIIDYVDIEEM